MMMENESKDTGKFEKKVHKWRAKENSRFEDYFGNLYDALVKRYEFEFKSIHNRDKKIEFLSELMDEIIQAKNEEGSKYIISPVVAKSRKKLTGYSTNLIMKYRI